MPDQDEDRIPGAADRLQDLGIDLPSWAGELSRKAGLHVPVDDGAAAAFLR